MLLSTMEEAATGWDDRSSGGGGKVMPSIWHEGSYVELERALGEMRDEGGETRRRWWHVCYRYRFGWQVRTMVRVVRTATGPQLVLPDRSELIVGASVIGEGWCRVLLYRWDERVKQEVADAGVHELRERMYGGDVEKIHLPKVFLQKALEERAHATG